MHLTAPPRRGSQSARSLSPTTAPGYTNPNHQCVIAATGAPSVTRARQTSYHLRCGACGFNYGCNGMDIKERRCPGCQAGVAGEPLREPQPGLFDTHI
jgi:hypothetical protein